MIERKTVLVDSETGEIISESQESFAAAMTEDGYRIPSHKAGARMFSGVLFPSELSDGELGKMSRLARSCMVGKTNMLGYRRNKSIIPYTADEIIELVGLCGGRGRRFLSKMQHIHMMQRVVTDSGPQYYINPIYYMPNGHRLSLDLFLLFRNWTEAILPRWVINDFLRQAQEKVRPAGVAEAERILKEG
jgi:hypothetical protein